MKSAFGGILFFLALMGPQKSFAQAAGAGAGGASTLNLFQEVTLSGGYLGFSTSSGQSNLALSYYFKPLRSDLFQVGGEYGYQSVSHRGSTSINSALLLGVAINIGSLSNAFYCLMGMALKGGSADAESQTSSDPNGFGYHFLCGKRIPIGGNPSWVFKPSVGVISGGTGGMVFRPLAVSYLF